MDMNDIFYKVTGSNGDLSKWDVLGVKSMDAMFYQPATLNDDISERAVHG